MFRFYYNLNSKHTVSKNVLPRTQYTFMWFGFASIKVFCFKTFIDGNGFSRVNDILPLSPMLTYDERFPKLLPYNGRFTQLYLKLILLLQMMRFEIWVP